MLYAYSRSHKTQLVKSVVTDWDSPWWQLSHFF